MRIANRVVGLLASFVWVTATTNASAEDELAIPDDDFIYCTTCHGVQLMGNPILRAPRISGIEAWYVEQQLKSFRNEWRGAHEGDLTGMEMRPMAAALTDEQIVAAAAYVNSTRSEKSLPTVGGDIDNGKRLYGTCSACHGVTGQGNEALGSPSLTKTSDWYLVSQLQNFKRGNRGGHSADTYGMQMRAAAQLLPDDGAINDVVKYISTL
ncbi:MAG: cytochrome c [Woeseia sp.]|jgi:cytochrome c553|nr:cytochrome c [Woeseia sp.]